MKDFLKEYFHYTRTERNGMFVLTALCLAFLITPPIYKHLFKKEEKTDFSHFQNQIDSFYKKIEAETVVISEIQLFPFDPNMASSADFQQLGLPEKVASTIVNYRNKGGRFYKKEDFKKIYGIQEADYERLAEYIVLKDKSREFESSHNEFEAEAEPVVELFEFDPNAVSREDLKRLGLSAKAINIMMNYRKKGGTFRKREDLSKIYGITDKDFERLFPYIKIAEEQPTALLTNKDIAEFPKSYENNTPLKIEINTSSKEEWQQLRGIGPYYAKMICGFRDKLGGFVSIGQVAETYNFPDSAFQNIKPFLVLNEAIKKIDLNTTSAKGLAVHPYLTWNQANAIVKYREQHGTFTSLDQLDNVRILDRATLQKIKPYLKE